MPKMIHVIALGFTLILFLGACLPKSNFMVATLTVVPSALSSPSLTLTTIESANSTPTIPAQTLTATVCENVPGKIQRACTSPTTGLHYWLYMPPLEEKSSTDKLPMLMYLHGFGHSGSHLETLLQGGPPAEIEGGRALPMVVVSPQCPSGDNWQYDKMVERLSRLVDEAVKEFNIDPDRVYLTGFSMGGDGVWALGLAHPQQFAALVPVGSWYADLKNICILKDVPVWNFQGEKDEIVPPIYAQNIIAALKQCGGNTRLALFTTGGHVDSSVQAYDTDELYTWLMAQKR